MLNKKKVKKKRNVWEKIWKTKGNIRLPKGAWSGGYNVENICNHHKRKRK